MKLIKIIFYYIFSFSVVSIATASPFYLTIEKSFSPNEEPSIKLDYQDDKNEMEIRILKPNDLDKFLDGQLNISRTYEEPNSKLNPGYFIAKGLNNVDIPLEKLRKLISPKFRSEFTNELENPLKILPKTDAVDKRRSLFILPPNNFTVVQKFRLPLLEKNNKSFNYDDSNEGIFYNYHTSYKQKLIRLPMLPAGIYLIQVIQENNEAQSILQVSDIAMQVKQSTSQILVTAVDRKLQPVVNASVYLRDSRGKWDVTDKTTDQNGQLLITSKTPLDSKLVVRIETKSQNAFASTEFLSVNEAKSDIFLMSDRPIFKPGEEVFYKGIMRSRVENKLTFPENLFNKKISRIDSIQLYDNHNKNILKENGVSLTKFGTFSGKIKLDENEEPGIYQLHAIADQIPYSGEFRVRDYVKPKFYLTLNDIKGTFYPGNKIAIKINATRYSGGAANDARYEVYVYRKKFEVPQWIAEEGYGLQSGSDYFGKNLSNNHNLPIRIFSSVEERPSPSESTKQDNEALSLKNKSEEVFSGSWVNANKFDMNGNSEFEFTIPHDDSENNAEFVYSLMIKSMDAQGSQAILSESYPVTLSEAYSTLAFKNKVIKTGDESNDIFINSTLPNGSQAKNAKGILKLSLMKYNGEIKNINEINFITNSEGIAKLKLPAINEVGKLMAVAKLTELNKVKMKQPSTSDQIEMIISDNINSPILNTTGLELYANQEYVEANSKVNIFALLPEKWGVNETGTAWMTIAGDKIFDHQKIDIKGKSQWIQIIAKESYGNGFFVTVTIPNGDGKFIERSMRFNIIRKSRILNVNVQYDQAIAEPLKPYKIKFLVTKNDGTAASNTELAISIVDKAVYDVQNDFRPKIFEFFYPSTKLNLMTFYSDDLQGYGYADKIRKGNFNLFSIKAKNHLAKNHFRDTAGWFPHVTTDKNGIAEITVDMPANITQWVVNVVAIDAEGKFGESKSTFRSATDVTTTPNISQFIREGDELNFNVRFSNQSTVSTKIDYSIKTDGGVEYVSNSSPKQNNLLPEKSLISNFTLRGVNVFGQSSLFFSTIAKNLRTGGVGEYLIALKPNGIKQVVSGVFEDNKISFPFSDNTKVSEIDVQASYGLSGQILLASKWLATYPYGCTEQLVSSTLPNLVLFKLFNDLGIKRDQFGPYSNIFEKIESNVNIGINKILNNQLENGAFSMWNTDPVPNVYMSIIAANGLRIAKRLGINEKIDTQLNNVKDWLMDQDLENKMYKNSKNRAENFIFIKNLALLGILSNQFIEKLIIDIQKQDESEIKLEELVYALEILDQWPEKNDSIAKLKNNYFDKLLSKLINYISTQDYEFSSKLSSVKISNSELSQNLNFPLDQFIIGTSIYNLLYKYNRISKTIEDKFIYSIANVVNMNAGSFGSTFTTAQVILNLQDTIQSEIKKFKKQFSNNEIHVYNNENVKIGNMHYVPGGYAINLEVKNMNVTNLKSLSLDKLPEGFFVHSFAKVFTPSLETKEIENGLSIQKEIYRYSDINKSLEKVLLKDLKVGDIAVSKLKINRINKSLKNIIPSDYIIVEDYIPSLAEVVDNDEIYLTNFQVKKASILETKRYADKIVRVVKLPSWNTNEEGIEIFNVWQIKFTGKSAIPPSKVTDMYDEKIFGISKYFEVVNN